MNQTPHQEPTITTKEPAVEVRKRKSKLRPQLLINPDVEREQVESKTPADDETSMKNLLL